MIIFFYGENDFKIEQKIKELENKFIKEVDTSGQNIFKFTGEDIKVEDISQKIANASLFCNKRMLIFNNLTKSKQKNILEKILFYLEKNNIEKSSDVFIFKEKNIKNKLGKLVKISGERESPLNKEEKNFFTFLGKQKFSQEFLKFNSSELLIFVKNQFLKNEVEIEKKEAELLIAIVGNNAWNLFNEINKISNYKKSQEIKTKLNEDDIKKISSGIFTENIFSFTDAISIKNTKKSLEILEEQYLAGLEPDYIISMLLRQFKILLQIRDLLDLNYTSQKINNSLKLHPFIINKGINQAKNFNKETIKKIINKLKDIELSNRGGLSYVKAEINLLISKL